MKRKQEFSILEDVSSECGQQEVDMKVEIEGRPVLTVKAQVMVGEANTKAKTK